MISNLLPGPARSGRHDDQDLSVAPLTKPMCCLHLHTTTFGGIWASQDDQMGGTIEPLEQF